MKFAASTLDISPPKGVLLAGWSGQNRFGDGKTGVLEANIFVFKSENTVVLVSIDTLFVSTQLKLSIINKIKSHQILPENIFIQATHTHFAPTLDSSKPQLGEMNVEYFNFVSDTIANELDLLLNSNRFDSIELFYDQTNTNLAINRRRRVVEKKGWRFFSFIQLAPNPLAYSTNLIKVLTIKNKHSQVVGLCWNFACHPVNYFNIEEVSADFIGIVSANLRKKYGSIPICFIQGFAGDIRANQIELLPRFKQLINTLLFRNTGFERFSEKSYTSWSNSLSEAVLSLVGSTENRISCTNIKAAIINRELKDVFESNNIAGKTVDFQLLSFDDKFYIAGISCEPSAKYEQLLNKMTGRTPFMAAGYINSVFLYLPTDKQLVEGGYESDGFIPYFNLIGKLKCELQRFFVFNFSELFDLLKHKRKDI